MRRAPLLSALALLPLGLPPAWSQPATVLAPPPPLPAPASPCVSRYGETGCGARLYAQLLCDSIGRSLPVPTLQQQLQAQFEQAGLRFAGVTAEQVESAAVRYYAPQLCPAQAGGLRELFYPSGSAAQMGP